MANRIIKDLSQLDNILFPVIFEELKKFAEEVKKALQQELKAKFYGREGYHQNSSGTDWYTRSWELLECIDIRPIKRNGSEFITEVFYNTDKMNTYPAENGEWSKHESITTGTDVRLMIPFWIEFGQDSPLYSWGEFNIVGDLTERLIDDRALLQHFESQLRKRGFKVIAG